MWWLIFLKFLVFLVVLLAKRCYNNENLMRLHRIGTEDYK